MNFWVLSAVVSAVAWVQGRTGTNKSQFPRGRYGKGHALEPLVDIINSYKMDEVFPQ